MIINYEGLRKATLLVGSTLTVMAGAIVAPALPQISHEFAHVPGIELLSRLLLTLPALFMGLLAPIAGFFIDRAGRKKVLLFSLILYALAGTTGLYLDNFFWILAGRAVLGIAVGGLITAVITLIGDYFEGEARNRFVGLQAAFAGAGGLIFISTGGVLADIHWRMPFLIYVISLFVWVMAVVSINDPITQKSQSKKDFSNSIQPKKKGIPRMVYFVYTMSFFSMIVFYMIPVQLPFMLSAMEGITNTGIGFAIAFVNVASVSTSVNYGRIKRKMSFASIMALVYLIVFAGFFIISQADSYVMTIAGIMVSGLGFGLMMPNINLWLITLAPAHLRGRLVGYLNMAVFVGMFASPIALQPLIRFGNIYYSFLLVSLMLLVMAVCFLIFALYTRRKGVSRY